MAAAGGGGGEHISLYAEEDIKVDTMMERINRKQGHTETNSILQKALLLDKIHDLGCSRLMLAFVQSILMTKTPSRIRGYDLHLFGLMEATRTMIKQKANSVSESVEEYRVALNKIVQQNTIQQFQATIEDLKRIVTDIPDKDAKTIKTATKCCQNLQLYVELTNYLEDDTFLNGFVGLSQGIAYVVSSVLNSDNPTVRKSLFSPEAGVKELIGEKSRVYFMTPSVVDKEQYASFKEDIIKDQKIYIDSGSGRNLGLENCPYGSMADASSGPLGTLCRNVISIQVQQNYVCTIAAGLMMHMTNLGMIGMAKIVSMSEDTPITVKIQFEKEQETKTLNLTLTKTDGSHCTFQLSASISGTSLSIDLNMQKPLYAQAGSILSLIHISDKKKYTSVFNIFGARSPTLESNSICMRRLHTWVANQLGEQYAFPGLLYEPMSLKSIGDFVQVGLSLITTDEILFLLNSYVGIQTRIQPISFWMVGGVCQGTSFVPTGPYFKAVGGEKALIYLFLDDVEKDLTKLTSDASISLPIYVSRQLPNSTKRFRQQTKNVWNIFHRKNESNRRLRTLYILKLLILCFMIPVHRVVGDTVEQSDFRTLDSDTTITDTNAWLLIKEDIQANESVKLHRDFNNTLYISFRINGPDHNLRLATLWNGIKSIITERITSSAIREFLRKEVGEDVLGIFINE